MKFLFYFLSTIGIFALFGGAMLLDSEGIIQIIAGVTAGCGALLLLLVSRLFEDVYR